MLDLFSIFLTFKYLVCACFQRVRKDPQSRSLESKLNSTVFTPSEFLFTILFQSKIKLMQRQFGSKMVHTHKNKQMSKKVEYEIPHPSIWCMTVTNGLYDLTWGLCSRYLMEVVLMCIFLSVCVFRSLQDVQIWFQPNTGSTSDVFLPHSDSQDGFGKSAS